MAKVLMSAHAEDVGGRLVEPGQEIPEDADADVVQRLEAEGKVSDSGSESQPPPQPARRASRPKPSSSEE